MGTLVTYVCRRCGTTFSASHDGGFFFDLLHCDTCGADRRITHEDLGDIHLAYIKGLPGPYALARSAIDRHIQATYPGEPLTREAYETAAEATLQICSVCAGTFRYEAPARCPSCRSTEEQWEPDPKARFLAYD